MKKKKKVAAGKAKTARKRTAAKDLSTRKSGAVKKGLLPAVKPASVDTSLNFADGSVRSINFS